MLLFAGWSIIITWFGFLRVSYGNKNVTDCNVHDSDVLRNLVPFVQFKKREKY